MGTRVTAVSPGRVALSPVHVYQGPTLRLQQASSVRAPSTCRAGAASGARLCSAHLAPRTWLLHLRVRQLCGVLSEGA